jgi:hypothetical protein
MEIIKKKYIKISLKIVSGILLLIIVLYFGLWFYVSAKVPRHIRQMFDQYTIYDLDEDQYKTIWFTFTENKNYKSKWYPFIIDICSNIDSSDKDLVNYTSSILASIDVIKTSQFLIIQWGLMRHIRWNYNYKKCISIIISENGMEDMSIHFFNKNIKDTSEEELIALFLFLRSSYEIGSDISKNRIEEIIKKYYE